MATYYINEAAFDLPDLGFSDQTVHVLRAKATSDGEINVLVFRNPLPEPKPAREVVTAHRDNERRSLAGFAVLFDREIELDGTVAIEAGIRFRHERGMVYQRNAHFVFADQHLLVVANAPFEDKDTCDRVMDHVLTTLRFRTE
ncbi:MAG: DcrB-related protein [Polyangiaceae bacterium]|nr:DcrB-related protein [Polyangiaceae bacterium]